MPRQIFTIGHSNQPLERLIALLRQHHIDVLADVRSQPYSRYVPHFNAEPLKAALVAAGLQYVYLGAELGGMPRDPALQDADGNVDYGRVAASALFQAGIDRVESGLAKYRVTLMCAEENPSHCHRRKLITPALLTRGIDVLHIRGDGQLESETELRASEAPAPNPQQTLFPPS